MASLDRKCLLIHSQHMTKWIFTASTFAYWVCTILELLLLTRKLPRLDKTVSVLEKVTLILFTIGIVLFISKLQIINGEIRVDHYDRPVSWLLFAWSLNAAHLTTEIAYRNRVTALFANFWTAMALTFPAGYMGLKSLFSNDLQWLSFHRLCFLLGYAFCILAFPLTLRYLLEKRLLHKANQEQKAQAEQSLWRLDRMAYRVILWSLPLLTAGIITELLTLIELNRLPSPLQVWTEQREMLLALATWFLCGIYLHTRIFFGWKNKKSAAVYLAGFVLLFVGHISHSLW